MTAMNRLRYLLAALLLASTATLSANSRLEFSLFGAGCKQVDCSVTDAQRRDSSGCSDTTAAECFVAASTGQQLSTIRLTQPGETFIRYESGNPAFSRVMSNGGLRPGTFTAPASEGIQPQGLLNELYNLPSPQIPRTNYFIIRPPEGTPVIGPGPVMGGSGNEVHFLFGAPPGSAGPRLPVPSGG
ncbi:MAG TPA: hypothetical protein VFE46_15085 [Pirellulales bacterium]|jgi:hypothetical protein|nr:hypothetical protein [Pirellulales bacterium]